MAQLFGPLALLVFLSALVPTGSSELDAFAVPTAPTLEGDGWVALVGKSAVDQAEFFLQLRGPLMVSEPVDGPIKVRLVPGTDGASCDDNTHEFTLSRPSQDPADVGTPRCSEGDEDCRITPPYQALISKEHMPVLGDLEGTKVFTVCLQRRAGTGWSTIPSITIGRTNGNPGSNAPYGGVQTCAELITQMKRQKVCGCYRNHAATQQAPLHLPIGQVPPSQGSLVQGCCADQYPVLPIGGGSWGVCTRSSLQDLPTLTATQTTHIGYGEVGSLMVSLFNGADTPLSHYGLQVEVDPEATDFTGKGVEELVLSSANPLNLGCLTGTAKWCCSGSNWKLHCNASGPIWRLSSSLDDLTKSSGPRGTELELKLAVPAFRPETAGVSGFTLQGVGLRAALFHPKIEASELVWTRFNATFGWVSQGTP